MLWIEIGTRWVQDGQDLTWTPYDEDQTTFVPGALVTPQQVETLKRITSTVDESACEAEDCCSTPAMPLGAYLSGDEDQCYLRGFFLATNGKALCEDCGIEILEKMQVVMAG